MRYLILVLFAVAFLLAIVPESQAGHHGRGRGAGRLSNFRLLHPFAGLKARGCG